MSSEVLWLHTYATDDVIRKGRRDLAKSRGTWSVTENTLTVSLVKVHRHLFPNAFLGKIERIHYRWLQRHHIYLVYPQTYSQHIISYWLRFLWFGIFCFVNVEESNESVKIKISICIIVNEQNRTKPHACLRNNLYGWDKWNIKTRVAILLYIWASYQICKIAGPCSHINLHLLKRNIVLVFPWVHLSIV